MEEYMERRAEELVRVSTKLDILIDDFKRFRKDVTIHSTEETLVQADIAKTQSAILTTLKWHKAIGTFMMTTIMYLLYKTI